jgi:hypothetical protein
MQKAGQRSPEASRSNDTQAKSCVVSSCLLSKLGFWAFFVPFALTTLVYQAGGSVCNGRAVSPVLLGFLAGMAGLCLYGAIKFAGRSLKKPSISREMPIQADYMRRTNLTISQLDLDENSALTRGSKEN